MPIFEWKSIAQAKYNAEASSIIATIIPIEAPHIQNFSSLLMETMENLQVAAYSGVSQGEKIILSPESIAAIYRHGEIVEIYRQDEAEILDLGSCLQKYFPWEREDLLVMADTQNFPVLCYIQAKKSPAFYLYFRMEVALNTEKIKMAIGKWLRLQPVFIVEDLRDRISDSIASADFLYYATPGLLRSELNRREIEKKAWSKIASFVEGIGLTLRSLELEGKQRENVNKPSLAMPGRTDITRRAENIVEAIEGMRIQQSLWEARYARTNEREGKMASPRITEKIVRKKEELPLAKRSPTEPADNGTLPLDRSSQTLGEIARVDIEQNIEQKRSRRLKKMALEDINGN